MTRLANETAYTESHKQIALLTAYILDSSCKLLGYIIRAADEDPIRQATLKLNTAKPHIPEKRRVGRPRKHWVKGTMEHIWHTLEDMRI